MNTLTEKERPCKEAYLKELKDTEGNTCSRYFIQTDSIKEADELGTKCDVDVLISRNLAFDSIISLVLYDEEIKSLPVLTIMCLQSSCMVRCSRDKVLGANRHSCATRNL